MVTSQVSLTSAPQAVANDPEKATAIEYLQGERVNLALRDGNILQGQLERIGWLSSNGEGISYLCLKIDNESSYSLTAQGLSSKSGVLFIPWDWVAYIVAP